MVKAQKTWVKHRNTPKFKVGDQVWLEGHNLHVIQPAAKLAPKIYGPFKVIQVMSPVNYHLELPTQWTIHPVFHIDLLMPYHETPIHSANYLCPPPDLIKGEEEYKVEYVLVKRRTRRCHQLQYLVKWKGYPDAKNQWINTQDMSADEAIAEFEHSNSAPREHIRQVFLHSEPHQSSGTCPSLGPYDDPLRTFALTSSPTNLPITSTSESFTTSPPNIPMSTPVSVRSTAVHFMTSNWEIHNPDATTPTASSDTSSGSACAPLAQTHYSLILESLRGPQSLGNQVPTPLPEWGGSKVESPDSSNNTPKLNAPEAQTGISGNPIGITPIKENNIPIPIPPPCHLITVDTATIDTNTEVQDAVLQALMHIHATASTETRGLFEDNLQDTKIVLGFANRL